MTVLDDGGSHERLVDQWAGSRSGAWASRGFSFQHSVGAWLAARLVSGDLHADSLVPEGLEDVSIEFRAPCHVQVKSRAEHLGAFPPGKAARHVLDAWAKHLTRGANLQSLAIVFERGVDGEAGLEVFGRSLLDSLSTESVLRAVICDVGRDRGLSDQDLDRLFAETSVFGISWASLSSQIRNHLRAIASDLPPTALEYLGRELRVVVAETADANGSPEYEHRRRLTRSDLTLQVQRFVEHIDHGSLEEALRHGICEPLSLSDELNDDRFYEGIDTQPGHVAAGLVVPRADLVGEALAGLLETSAVVLTGPSGVGKSAVLWLIPEALQGVLWFRVRRLSEGDVPHLIRLARAYRASDSNPVGFLVDAAGTGEFSGWARLRAEASAVSGLLLVTTARQEDLVTLGDLTGCVTIAVALNEEAAATIYEGLKQRNATTEPHWQEAFEQSNGLTMEFTYLLTNGRRLNEVITDQVRRRVEEGRFAELDLLSLTAVANRWSATIPVEAAAQACRVSQFELRGAVSRLAAEHLLVEVDGTISGVHRLRSAAISKAIHNQPPPTLEFTAGRVLEILTPEQLARFIPNALRDEPMLHRVVAQTATRETLGIARLTAYLRGLRLFDFYQRALTWRAIADRHGVPRSNQPLVFFCATAGVEFSDMFPRSVFEAREEMSSTNVPSRSAELVAAIGVRRLTDALVNTSDLNEAAMLIFELEGSGAGLADELVQALSAIPPLRIALREGSVGDFAEVVSAARSVDPTVASALVDAAGGEAVVLDRIQNDDPWITELDIRCVDGGSVAYCRLLHVSDDVHGDPHSRVTALGQLLLRCLPRTESVDVKVVLPGGHDYSIGDYEPGVTKLKREYDHPELQVAWNQERMRVTNTILGETDTVRLAAAIPLLDEAVDLTAAIGNVFTSADATRMDAGAISTRSMGLGEQALKIGPHLGTREFASAAGNPSAVFTTDHLSGIITDLTGNVFPRLIKLDNPAALAGHLRDHVIQESLRGAQQEPWRLLGFATYPQALDTLDGLLADLHATIGELAFEPDSNIAIIRAARAGAHGSALHRAGEVCRTRAKRRSRARREQLENLGREIGHPIRVQSRHDDQYEIGKERMITMNLESLLDWSLVVGPLSSKLLEVALPGESFLLVPLRNGRPVPALAMTLISSLLQTGTLGDWAPALDAAHATPLASLLKNALSSIHVRSGIAVLPEEKRTHTMVQSIFTQAEREFAAASVELSLMPTDAITIETAEILQSLDRQIRLEFAGTASAEPIAEQILQSELQGVQTELTTLLIGVRLMALEWDIDRDNALNLLASI